MIAQDASKHPGSIIRIHLDGIFQKIIQSLRQIRLVTRNLQIGIRNPQGMALSKFDGKIYISNHGAKEAIGLES